MTYEQAEQALQLLTDLSEDISFIRDLSTEFFGDIYALVYVAVACFFGIQFLIFIYKQFEQFTIMR